MKKLCTAVFILTSLILAGISKLNAKSLLTAILLQEGNQHEISSETLVLNKGAKWKVDHTTNNNIGRLKLILQTFTNGKDKSLKGYKKIGEALQNGLIKMISECRMKGPDHLALHKWLEPLMAQVLKLKKASTNEGAEMSMNFVHLQLNRYNQFFEL